MRSLTMKAELERYCEARFSGYTPLPPSKKEKINRIRYSVAKQNLRVIPYVEIKLSCFQRPISEEMWAEVAVLAVRFKFWEDTRAGLVRY